MAFVPVVVFGFDYDKKGSDIGVGTRLRCGKAVEVARWLARLGEDVVFLVSAGRAPGVTPAEQPLAMAEMMKRYFESRCRDFRVIVLPPAWGTRGELTRAVEFLQGQDVKDVCLVSNRLHLGRIAVIARRLTRRRHLPWSWHYERCVWPPPAWRPRHSAEELLKIFREIARCFIT